jgi:hypothetical protein
MMACFRWELCRLAVVSASNVKTGFHPLVCCCLQGLGCEGRHGCYVQRFRPGYGTRVPRKRGLLLGCGSVHEGDERLVVARLFVLPPSRCHLFRETVSLVPNVVLCVRMCEGKSSGRLVTLAGFSPFEKDVDPFHVAGRPFVCGQARRVRSAFPFLWQSPGQEQ